LNAHAQNSEIVIESSLDLLLQWQYVNEREKWNSK